MGEEQSVIGGARAGRVAALTVALGAAALGVLLLPSPEATSAAPTQDCATTISTEPCTPDPTLTSSTTSTPVTEETTTSTSEPTSTTVRRTTTTTTRAAAQGKSTSTTLSPTTSADLLVPGDGTAGAELTTTTLLTATRISDGGPSDGTLITLVIVGLLLIAGVVGVLTWRYWVATRPPLLDTDVAPPSAR